MSLSNAFVQSVMIMTTTFDYRVLEVAPIIQFHNEKAALINPDQVLFT